MLNMVLQDLIFYRYSQMRKHCAKILLCWSDKGLSIEFKQPLGCFFFPLTLSLYFPGWAGSNHSGSALRGGLRLSDYSAERVGQAHAVLAPFSHKYLSHQVRNQFVSVLGWKFWFFTCQSNCLHSGPSNLFINPSEHTADAQILCSL